MIMMVHSGGFQAPPAKAIIDLSDKALSCFVFPRKPPFTALNVFLPAELFRSLGDVDLSLCAMRGAYVGELG